MSDTSTDLTLPVMPVTDGVVFPGAVVTIAPDSDQARAALSAARATGSRLLLVPHLDGRYSAVGTIAVVEQAGELPTGQPAAVLRAVQRARIGAGVPGVEGTLTVQVEPMTDPRPSVRIESLGRELRAIAEGIAEQRRSRRLPEILRSVTEPGALADAITGWSDASLDHKITVLELTEPGARVEFVLEWAKAYLSELTVTAKIRDDVSEGMERTQREFLLRQQMEAIRKELGEDDAGTGDYQTRLEALREHMPETTFSFVQREVERLERTSAQSPEQGWLRTWLDRVLELPWGRRSDDRLDIVEARAVLDADHTGLDDVKDRIIEHLAGPPDIV